MRPDARKTLQARGKFYLLARRPDAAVIGRNGQRGLRERRHTVLIQRAAGRGGGGGAPGGGDYIEELHGGTLDLYGVAPLTETALTIPSFYGRIWTTR